MDDEEDIDYIDPRLQRQATRKRKTGDTPLRSAKTNVCPATRRPAPPQINNISRPQEQFSTVPNSTTRQHNDGAIHTNDSPSVQIANNSYGSESIGSATPVSEPPSSHGTSTSSVVSLPGAALYMNQQPYTHHFSPSPFDELQEDEAQIRIERFARQQFMCTLNNQELEAPVRRVYPGMSPIHRSYKEAINKVRDLYKTWKNRTLTEASKIFEEIIIPEYTNLANATKLRHLGDILMNHFCPQWLP